MTAYRVYRIKDKHIRDAPSIVVADNDQQATEQAKQLVDGCDVELWDGPRFVIGIKSRDK